MKSLKEGYEIGDLFGVTGKDVKYEIVGFSSKTTYQTAPVVFMSLDTWQTYRYGSENTPDLYSGVVVKGKLIICQVICLNTQLRTIYRPCQVIQLKY